MFVQATASVGQAPAPLSCICVNSSSGGEAPDGVGAGAIGALDARDNIGSATNLGRGVALGPGVIDAQAGADATVASGSAQRAAGRPVPRGRQRGGPGARTATASHVSALAHAPIVRSSSAGASVVGVVPPPATVASTAARITSRDREGLLAPGVGIRGRRGDPDRAPLDGGHDETDRRPDRPHGGACAWCVP